MDIPTVVFDNPYLSTALVIVFVVALAYLRTVGPRRAIAAERIRGPVFRVLNPIATKYGRPLVRVKSDTEYIETVDATLLQVARVLWTNGYRYNPISTKKARTTDNRTQWSILTVALRDDILGESQHHVYLFRNPEGGIDIYGHEEANITDLTEHEGGDEQRAGDPNDSLKPVLETLRR